MKKGSQCESFFCTVFCREAVSGAEKGPNMHHSPPEATSGAEKHSFVHQNLSRAISGAGKGPNMHHSPPEETSGAEKHSFMHQNLSRAISGARKGPNMHHSPPEATSGAEKHSFMHRKGSIFFPTGEMICREECIPLCAELFNRPGSFFVLKEFYGQTEFS